MFKKFVGLGLLTIAAGTVVYTVAKRIKKNDCQEETIESNDEVIVEDEECACASKEEPKCEACAEDQLEVTKENNNND